MKALRNNSIDSSIFNQRVSLISSCRALFLGVLVIGFSINVPAQSLSWLTPSSIGVTISGVPGRPSPAAAVFNGQMYVAYTSTVSAGDPQPNNLVYVGSGTGLV